MRYEDNHIITDYKKRAKTDHSLRGINKIAKEQGKEVANKMADIIIKNTYRTLMTRGMNEEEAKALIVRGFANPIAKEFPIEYEVEMNNLINIELKGAIG